MTIDDDRRDLAKRMRLVADWIDGKSEQDDGILVAAMDVSIELVDIAYDGAHDQALATDDETPLHDDYHAVIDQLHELRGTIGRVLDVDEFVCDPMSDEDDDGDESPEPDAS